MTDSTTTPHPPASVAELLDRLGGNAVVAKMLGKGQSTVSEWRRAKRIDVRYWPALIDAADEVGVDGINPDTLMRICAGIANADPAR